MAIQVGSITNPTVKSATHKEAKNRFEIVRKGSFLWNSHSTAAFPITAAKPVRESHRERTMDDALLSRSLKLQLIFMLSLSKTTREI